MSLITVQNLTFAYEGSYDNIFENTSFQIDTDWKLGFIGRNGRGKTTFLRLLQQSGKGGYSGKRFKGGSAGLQGDGEVYTYQGSISASVDFEYFPYEPENPDAMAIEVVDEVVPDYEYWQLSRELNLLELDDEVLYRPFRQLSPGERTKILMAGLFLKKNSFLLIDEPTNHLDVRGRELVADYLNKKKGFILISHDRMFLDRCIDHVLSINKASITVEKGNFSTWQQNMEYRTSYEMSQNERLQKDIRKMEAAAQRAARWSDRVERTKNGPQSSGLKPDKGYVGARAAAMMKRSKTIEVRQQRALDEKSSLLKDVERGDSLKLSPLKYRQQVLLRAEKLILKYVDGSQPVCGPLDFQVERGERLVLAGPNGCGKSTIIKCILNETGVTAEEEKRLLQEGLLQVGSGLIVSYVPQSTDRLKGSLTDFTRKQGIDESQFKAILRKLDFDRVQFEKPMEAFSQGQKKKVLIAGSLCQQAHLYIWDEPMNYIDVISRMQIEELILQYEPTMIFVEHDVAFCENVATAVLPLRKPSL